MLSSVEVMASGEYGEPAVSNADQRGFKITRPLDFSPTIPFLIKIIYVSLFILTRLLFCLAPYNLHS